MLRLLAAVLLVATGCVSRAEPYRFASPMIGGADVPPVRLGHRGDPDVRHPVDPYPASARSASNSDKAPAVLPAEPRPIRVASARAADDVGHEPSARGVVWSRLPAPNQLPANAPMPAIHEVADLRALIGRRDKRDSVTAALQWSAELGHRGVRAASGSELVASATSAGMLAPPNEAASGDLLVFDRTDSDAPADLVALAIGRDARGVIELVYVAGGVIRRGFADPHRPALRRDAAGTVVNTFMRAGKRWPPKGTHYLAGELLANVIRTR